jgi:chemotaxis signal transduction protein
VRALIMPVGADWYAIEMARVREVVASPMLASVPTAPATLLGVFNLRGEIVPLFDTAALLGLGRVSAPSHATVVDTALGPAGLVASAIPESVELGEPTGATETPGTVASYTLGSRLATLIDVETLLSPARIGSWRS